MLRRLRVWFLRRRILDENSDVRAAAVTKLGKVGAARDSKWLLPALGDPVPEVRRVTATSFVAMGDETWQSLVIGDEDDFVRLARSGSVGLDIIAEQFEQLKGDHDALIRALSESGTPEAITPLRIGLEARLAKSTINEKRCVTIIEGIARLGGAHAIRSLQRIVFCSHVDLRKEAVARLLDLGDARWIEWVTGSGDDLKNIAKSNDEGAKELLLEAFKTDATQGPLLDAVCQLDDTRAFEPMLKCVKSFLDTRRKMLGAAKNSLGKQFLSATLLRDANWRAETLLAGIGKFKDARAIPSIIECLIADTKSLQDGAESAIIAILGPSEGKRLAGAVRRAKQTVDGYVRETAMPQIPGLYTSQEQLDKRNAQARSSATDLERCVRGMEERLRLACAPTSPLGVDGSSPADTGSVKTTEGMTEKQAGLILAAEGGDASTVSALLATSVDPNCRDAGLVAQYSATVLGPDADVTPWSGRGYTALHRASLNGHFDVVGILLDHGANIESKAEGLTPLFGAVQGGHTRVLDLLLSRGADIEARADDGATPLHMACQKGLADIATTLIDRGAEIEAKKHDGATPLRMAIYNGHDGVARTLLDLGARADCTDEDGTSALYAASYLGFASIVEMLLHAGCAPNRCDARGATPLHAAANAGHTAVVDMLLQSGADVEKRDGSGATPADAAIQGGNDVLGSRLRIHMSRS